MSDQATGDAVERYGDLRPDSTRKRPRERHVATCGGDIPGSSTTGGGLVALGLPGGRRRGAGRAIIDAVDDNLAGAGAGDGVAAGGATASVGGHRAKATGQRGIVVRLTQTDDVGRAG